MSLWQYYQFSHLRSYFLRDKINYESLVWAVKMFARWAVIFMLSFSVYFIVENFNLI